MSIASQKLGFRAKLFELKKSLSVLMKNKQSLGYKIQILQNYSAPYGRESKIQHPTSRVVGTLTYAPALHVHYYFPRHILSPLVFCGKQQRINIKVLVEV